jgi:hypothetical protein
MRQSHPIIATQSLQDKCRARILYFPSGTMSVQTSSGILNRKADWTRKLSLLPRRCKNKRPPGGGADFDDRLRDESSRTAIVRNQHVQRLGSGRWMASANQQRIINQFVGIIFQKESFDVEVWREAQ